MGDERRFQSSSGYADVVESHYVYDSTVPNARRVGVGDLVVVRDRDAVLGAAYVERIDVDHHAEKVRYRCPGCASTNFETRKTLRPTHLCRKCRLEFEERGLVTIEVTRYVAWYGGTWRGIGGALSVERLRAVSANNSTQQSINPLRINGLEELLRERLVPLPPPARTSPVVARPQGGHRDALVKVRNGQASFRRQLLQRYGLVCAVTGPCPVEALQAAHLRAFAEHATHRVEEGLLLRADIHQLFDRGLMVIHPTTLTVHVAPALCAYPVYEVLEGRVLGVKGLDRSALRAHFEVAIETWGSVS